MANILLSGFSKTKLRRITFGIAAWGLTVASALGSTSDETINFESQIRPILSDRCFACHGPDEADREADLRLDERASATRAAEYGERPFVIKPGDPSASELLLRLTTNDEDIKMPPPESHLKVTTKEIELIEEWISQGADWSEHWSFQPVTKIKIPDVKQAGWARNFIDQFVLEKLAEQNLVPNAEADQAVLARRLYFDLTGLPPTVKQLDDHLKDQSPNAYENLVDQLLANKSYGERMAVEWLDVARYADTYGYQTDFEAHVWPYRDWVVKAFNENLSFDDFITWQLAGDLLPNPTRDQILATAFNRLHRQTNEGGSVLEEFRLEYVADRVDTFGVAFMGLSVGCARCHDHKFDPISQKEYYQLSAFFDNIDEIGVFAYFTKATPTPALNLPTMVQSTTLQQLASAVSEAEQRFLAARKLADAGFEAWLKNEAGQVDFAELLQRNLIAHFDFEETIEKEVPATTDANGKQAEQPKKETYVKNRIDSESDAKLHESPRIGPGKQGNAIYLNGDNGWTSSVTKDLTRHDSFSFSFWMRTAPNENRATVLHTTLGHTDAGSRGIEIVMTEGKLYATICHFWPGNAMQIRATDKMPFDRWVHVGFSYDGSSQASGMHLYLDGKPIDTVITKDKLTRTIRHIDKDKVDFKEGNKPTYLTVGYRYRDRGFKNGQMDELRIYDRLLSDAEMRWLAGTKNVSATHDELQQIHQTLHWNQVAQLWAELRSAKLAHAGFAEKIESIMVMKELAQPRKTFIRKRGAYDSPGEEVQPGAISKLLPFDKNLPRNRLGLAKWLTDPKNPLPSRVAVNRIWQIIMGRGLVGTQEDFGSQGSRPSHPELLDYLSYNFMQNEWDVKKLIRQIVTSATYRQDSTCSPAMQEQDPENEWLARGPSQRLSAEMIRDSALAASGLLVNKMGGPPVKPYQPPGLWKESMNIEYQRDPEQGSRRRSLYSYWKRTLPPPAMMTFDAANREVCTARREATATPLQALVLLNDPQFIEASRSAAQNAVLVFDRREDQIGHIFRAFSGRVATPAQLELMMKTYSQQFEYFASAKEEAAAFLSIGDLQMDESIDNVELAAMTVVAQMIMNLDYFVMKR